MLDRIDELELAGMRSGRDQYSKLNLDDLVTMMPKEAIQIVGILPLEEEQKSALRSVMCGLSVEKAVAKVELDRQMVKTIWEKRRFQKKLQEGLGVDAETVEAWKSGKF